MESSKELFIRVRRSKDSRTKNGVLYTIHIPDIQFSVENGDDVMLYIRGHNTPIKFTKKDWKERVFITQGAAFYSFKESDKEDSK